MTDHPLCVLPHTEQKEASMSDDITAAKFRLEQLCVLPGHGKHGKEASYGSVCDSHAADLRDLVADVHDLAIAYAEGDAINPERSEHRGKNPHPPVPIRLNAFIIGHHGGDPVEWTWRRNGNVVSGRLESNGPDAPDIPAVIYRWADALAVARGIDWPTGDTLAKLDFIRRHLDWVTELPEFKEFLASMRACRRALAAAIGEQPGPQPLGKCPECRTALYTDWDREVIRRRRAGEFVTGEDAKPIKAKANRVACQCGAVWEGAGLIRLKLILEAS